MKIAKVETLLLAIPFEDHGGIWDWGSQTKAMHTLILRLETNTGLVGWGEIFTNNRADDTASLVSSHISPALIGRDTSDGARIKHDLEVANHNAGRIGPLAYAIAGVDIALWDLLGKQAGLPLWRLLGGARRPRLKCYASLTRYGAPGPAAEACVRAREQGFAAVKLHEIDPLVVTAARSAVGDDLALMVDASCAWSLSEATDAVRAMAPARLAWIEEPIWPPENYRALAEVRQAAGVPIAAGENAGGLFDFRAMFESGAVDIVQPDLIKSFGITEVLKVAALAEAFNVSLVPHAFVPGPGYAAALHLCAALNHEPLLERWFVDMAVEPMGDAVRPLDGHVTLPSGPGLGCEPDPEAVARFRVA